jgi:exopolysaccharide biosynthesis polyprenyl glycosylphosphotransferase
VLLAADAAAALTSAAIAYLVRFEAGWIAVEGRLDVLPSRYLAALPVTIGVMLLSASLVGAYGDEELRHPTPVRRGVRVAALAGALLAATALLYRDVFQYSRLAIAFAGIAYLPAFVLGRLLAVRAIRSLRARGRGARRAAVIGGGAPGAALEASLREHPWVGVDVRTLVPVGEVATLWPDATRLSDVEALLDDIARGAVDEVYVAVPATEAGRVPELVQRLESTTVDVRVVPDLGAVVMVNPHAFVLSGVPIVSLRERPLYGVRAAAKRTLDVALAVVLLIALAPWIGLLALAVRVSSRGSAFYAQERMGLDGRRFRMWKLRTMRTDAEATSGPVFARRDDPRVTALGRFLRRFSLDELPQLWNVVRGEMSLVGPRPERETFVEEFRKSFSGYMLRHSVRSGMTGWAQVHGLRGDSSLSDRLRYDLEYIDRWSLLLDLEILCRTVSQVLVGRNAY